VHELKTNPVTGCVVDDVMWVTTKKVQVVDHCIVKLVHIMTNKFFVTIIHCALNFFPSTKI
jgi:hypothetical protein